MDAHATTAGLAEAGSGDPAVLGRKAVELARLSAAGFPVPPGLVVTADSLDDPELDAHLRASMERLDGGRFAVRSSSVAEDLPDASYAGV